MTSSALGQHFLGLHMLLLATLAQGQAQRQAPEPELKAAILVNLLLFVDWKSQGMQPKDRFTACYLEAGPVAAALTGFEGRQLKGKPLRVVRVEPGQVGGCHLLYLSPAASMHLPRIAPLLRDSGILLAGDATGYLQRGVMLNLDLEEGRIVFDIDLQAVRQAGLALSSKVLRLARQVKED
jgi:hypothetical protein